MLTKDIEPGERKFTSDLINITANNIINKIYSKGIRVNSINSTNEFIYIGKVRDSTYEIKINIKNINTNINNNRIYKLKVIIK